MDSDVESETMDSFILWVSSSIMLYWFHVNHYSALGTSILQIENPFKSTTSQLGFVFEYIHPRVLEKIDVVIQQRVIDMAKESASDIGEDEAESIQVWLEPPQKIARFFHQTLAKIDTQ